MSFKEKTSESRIHKRFSIVYTLRLIELVLVISLSFYIAWKLEFSLLVYYLKLEPFIGLLGTTKLLRENKTFISYQG